MSGKGEVMQILVCTQFLVKQDAKHISLNFVPFIYSFRILLLLLFLSTCDLWPTMLCFDTCISWQMIKSGYWVYLSPWTVVIFPGEYIQNSLLIILKHLYICGLHSLSYDSKHQETVLKLTTVPTASDLSTPPAVSLIPWVDSGNHCSALHLHEVNFENTAITWLPIMPVPQKFVI